MEQSSLGADSTYDQLMNPTSPSSGPSESIETTIPPLDVESQQRMMQSIVEIFQLDEDPATENAGWEEHEDTAEDLEERSQRTERLRNALPLLQQLWWSRSDLMPIVTEKLADGSRCIKWRGPIGDAGILDFFLEFLNMHDIQHNLMVHVLRLVGNSCADTDSNRERVVSKNRIPSIISQLQNALLLPFVIPVLFNVCVDYEPAQQQASESHLSKELTELISSPRFFQSQAFIGYVCKIFDFLISQPAEPDRAPDNTPVVLLTLATDKSFQPDLEDFMALTTSAIAYLKHQRFQESLIDHPFGLPTAIAVLTDSYNRFTLSGDSDLMDMDSDKELSQLRFELILLLSDISALPKFSVTYPLNSSITTSIIQLISSAPSTNSAQSRPQLVIAACIILGNLARTDVTCQTLVHSYSIHVPLTLILSSASRVIDSSTPISSQAVQLTHSVLGLLRNLGIPTSNKKSLGDAGLLEANLLPRLWSLDNSPQIQYTAITLTRQMIIGCLPNVIHLCRPLSSDPDSPASGKSSLHLLLDLQSRSDTEATKMEIARLVAAVCRVLHTKPSSESSENNSDEELSYLRKKFYEIHTTGLRLPLTYLLIQNQAPTFSSTSAASFNNPSKYPVLRSEGWFVLALMAGTVEGSQVVEQCMHDASVFGLTCEILSGKTWDASVASRSGRIEDDTNHSDAEDNSLSSMVTTTGSPQAVPAGANGADEGQRARDRSNVLVMVSELLRNYGDNMASFRKEIFEDLVKVGGRDVASETEILHRET